MRNPPSVLPITAKQTEQEAIELEFVSDKVLYKHFKPFRRFADLIPGMLLGIAWFDGEPELWVVDPLFQGERLLRNYYRLEWGDREIPMQFLSTL